MTSTLDDADLDTAVRTAHYTVARWRPGKSHPASRTNQCPCSTCELRGVGELEPIETLPWLAGPPR
jgi:hypothetical protein